MNNNQRSLKSLIKSRTDTMTLFAIIVVIAAFMGFMDKSFLTGENFSSIAFQIPELGILTLGMMLPMITSGINLSIIANANLASILMGMILTTYAQPESTNIAGLIIITILVGLTVSAVIGLLNGLVITKLKVPPIVATLSIQLLVDGVSTAITKGYVIGGIPKEFMNLASATAAGIPVIFLLFMALTAFIAILLYKTALGKSVYMYGSNSVATLFSGVNADRLLIKTYVISNLFAGVTAVIMLARFNSASMGYSTSYLLQTVLICVLGGLNPNGGSGRVLDVIMAIIILRLVANGFTLINVSSYLTLALWGVLLLLVLAIKVVDFRKLNPFKGGKALKSKGEEKEKRYENSGFVA